MSLPSRAAQSAAVSAHRKYSVGTQQQAQDTATTSFADAVPNEKSLLGQAGFRCSKGSASREIELHCTGQSIDCAELFKPSDADDLQYRAVLAVSKLAAPISKRCWCTAQSRSSDIVCDAAVFLLRI